MSYQKRLKDFFKKNDPDRLYLAKQIARNFRQDEDAVFKRLEEIYQKGGPSKLVYKEITKSIEPSRPVHSSANDHDNVNSESQRISKFQSLQKQEKTYFNFTYRITYCR